MYQSVNGIGKLAINCRATMFKLSVFAALVAIACAAAPYGLPSYGRSHGYSSPSYHRNRAYASAPVPRLQSYASAPAPQYGGHRGYSGGYGHDYAQPIPYDFGYDIAGDHGEFKQSRKETGDGHGNVQGSYGYVDAHGIQRQVDYVADGHGFRAQIKTNEPGTDNQNPADVQLAASPAHYSAPHHAAPYGAPRYGRHY